MSTVASGAPGRAEQSKQRTHISEQLAMDSGEVGDEREQSLENSELNIDTLVYAIAHRGDDEGYGGLGYGFEGDETLKRAEGDCDDLGILRFAAHEHRPEKIFRLWAICSTRMSRRR